MPAGPRITANNVYGTIDDSPLTAGSTTLNSTELSLLPVVSSAHAVLVLDPKRVSGEPEIVIVTAHTASATVATITRGAYGTVARSHIAGTPWAHVPVIDDYERIATSAARPSDPYEGQTIWETDTDFTKYWNGTTWEQGLTIGQFTSWTPVITQSGVVTKTIDYARFTKTGRLVTASYFMTVTGSGTGANAVVISGLPFNTSSAIPAGMIIGSGTLIDISAGLVYKSIIRVASSTTLHYFYTGSTNGNVLGVADFTAGLAVGDILTLTINYEAVS